MTRFIHDKFSKDYLEVLLSPHGQVEVSKSITSEIKEIDVWFMPNSPEIPTQLGLLGRLCQNPTLLEPYRNPVTVDEINNCLFKLLAVLDEFQREAKRNKRRLVEEEKPKLWILTPTASSAILERFCAQLKTEWGRGIYFLPQPMRTAIVVIHQLPEESETLWLRLLGRGGTKSRAIDELEALSAKDPLRSTCLELLYNLSRNLAIVNNQLEEDRRLIMRLAPLYQQDREQAIQQGLQQGLQQEGIALVMRQLRRRCGEIPLNLTEQIRQLSLEEVENLAEALLDFQTQVDLVNWLNTIDLTGTD